MQSLLGEDSLLRLMRIFYSLVMCCVLITTLCPKNDHIFIFLNNSVKNEPILIIFDILNPEGT